MIEIVLDKDIRLMKLRIYVRIMATSNFVINISGKGSKRCEQNYEKATIGCPFSDWTWN